MFEGVARLTLPLPLRPNHVHCYLLEGDDGWTLVDAGLALPDSAEVFAAVATEVRVKRIVVTHFHPDHVGGAGYARAATGAAVHQGDLDYEQCVHVWGNDAWPDVIARWFRRNGVPSDVANELIDVGSLYAPFIQYADEPQVLRPGETVGGWSVVATPGHADGHLCLVRDGTLVAGDHLLPTITPAVGLYPDSRPDPLGDYLQSLRETASLELTRALPGHGDPIADPAARCRELLDHHERRLSETKGFLGGAPKTAYDVSLSLFPDANAPAARRFAVAETLSHLERLVHAGEAARDDDGQTLSYTDS